MIVEARKLCAHAKGCGQWLPISQFAERPRMRDGRQRICRCCQRKLKSATCPEKLERRRENQRRWRVNNPIRNRALTLLSNVKHACNTDIDINWINERLASGVCEVTGLPFSFAVEKRHPFAPSIDRIDPSQPGHMRDNCRMVLWCVNGFKGTASEEAFRIALRDVAHAIVNKS